MNTRMRHLLTISLLLGLLSYLVPVTSCDPDDPHCPVSRCPPGYVLEPDHKNPPHLRCRKPRRTRKPCHNTTTTGTTRECAKITCQPGYVYWYPPDGGCVTCIFANATTPMPTNPHCPRIECPPCHKVVVIPGQNNGCPICKLKGKCPKPPYCRRPICPPCHDIVYDKDLNWGCLFCRWNPKCRTTSTTTTTTTPTTTITPTMTPTPCSYTECPPTITCQYCYRKVIPRCGCPYCEPDPSCFTTPKCGLISCEPCYMFYWPPGQECPSCAPDPACSTSTSDSTSK